MSQEEAMESAGQQHHHDEDGGGNTSSNQESAEALGKAFFETLVPIAEDYTAHVNEVIVTQQHLSESIDSLVVNLNRVKGSLGGYPEFSTYTKKLLTSRAKVEALGRSLSAIEARINRMTMDIRRICPDAFDVSSASALSASEVPEQIVRTPPLSPQK